MTASAEALWSRALRAADARGLLPANRSRLTPAELAAEVARRGEVRLERLVDGWYYPASYGHVRGVLSDEEAVRLVAALEVETLPASEALPKITPPLVEDRPARRKADCELCGYPLPSNP